MKAFIKALLCCSLIASLLLTGCSGGGTGDDTTTPADTDPVETPAVDPAKHNITLSEIQSILAANELRTNINTWAAGGGVWHGGMQMRVCHTERGTYSVFAKEFGEDDADGIQKYYVSKVDNDGNSSILYYGEFDSDDAEITINVGQDTTGDIIVTAISEDFHGLYIFDKDTDTLTKYEMEPTFKSESKLGYSQTMFDFENRKVYPFIISGSGTNKETVGDSIIEWYSFDLDTGEWSEESVLMRTEDIGRHGYLYPFPDGEGGAYIAAIRNEYSIYAEGRFSLSGESYLWDRLGLFHIPDLSTGENSEYVVVQEEDDSQGLEGIWSHVHHNNYGDVFVDSDGYMHITYRYWLMDYSGEHTDFDNQLQYRHAVYDGLECIFNEKLEVPEAEHQYYRPIVRQSTDGKLHLILVKMWDFESIKIDFYSAEDELGRSWKHEKRVELDEGVNTDSLTVSGVRDGSVQDDVLSVFFYGYKDYDNTGYNFNISLKDYSVTELVNILEGYDLQLDWRMDVRVPSADHQTAVINTENATYAAFVYNYNRDEGQEYYHIVKIDSDKKATILHSDSFESEQDKYLTMSRDADGMIYVCPPTGQHVYTVDPASDQVTERELTPIITNKLRPRQSAVVYDSATDNNYSVSVLLDGALNISSNVIDGEKLTVALKNAVQYPIDRELSGKYDGIYTLSDGKGGLYCIGTRSITRDDTDGKLEYNGYLKNIDDSIIMLHVGDINDTSSVSCIDVEAPYEAEGTDGIWSVVKINDVFLDSSGKLNILYVTYHFDFDDKDRRENPELIKNSSVHYLAVYDGGELVSREEIGIDGLGVNTSLRMTETTDGTVYLITCNLQRGFENLSFDKLRYNNYPEDGDAVLSVYCETEDGWKLAVKKDLGQFAADGFFIGDSQNSDSVDCLIYASDNDVYHLNISFEAKN